MTKLALAGLFVLLPLPLFAAEHGSVGGRYQLVQLGTARADQYLIDSQTGAVWRSVCKTGEDSPNCHSLWQRQLVEGLNISTKAIERAAEIQKQAASAAEHASP